MSVLSKNKQMFGKADTNIFASDLDLSKKNIFKLSQVYDSEGPPM